MKKETPYVPANNTMPEFTIKAVVLGLLMAIVLGAANAYLGLKSGITVSAAFPAAVIAIAAFRLPFFRGTILEQNIARTMASVGESMAAAAIFILPAFVMVNVGGQHVWTNFNYWETVVMMLVGGLLGCTFIILLRRTLTIDADLPFPEATACYEIVKTGQRGESGASYLFGALGIGVLIQLLKSANGIAIFKETKEFVFSMPHSLIRHFTSAREQLGTIAHNGVIAFSTPLASPALMGIGYIIGPKYSSLLTSGGVLAQLVFIPLVIFVNPNFLNQLSANGQAVSTSDMVFTAWFNIVRPIAVGAMLVGSFYTLFRMRSSITASLRGIFSHHKHKHVAHDRLDSDLNLRAILICSLGLIIPMVFVYQYFTNNWVAAVVAAILMAITGFLFAAVSGWLAGLVGLSNQPLSGLILSTLIIAALIMLAIGMTGIPGIAATLGIATIIAATAAMSGDMIQDLKIGRFIGGTPWKMEFSNIISTVVVAFVVVFPLILLHQGNIAAGGIGIGDKQLPAPQAGLMAQLATGLMSGEMPWALIIVGMFFAIGLIMFHAPSPMLIAVGMYIPLETNLAIFVGGIFKWVLTKLLAQLNLSDEARERVENKGILVASGFIAGEAMTGVLMAGMVMLGIHSLSESLFGVKELAIYERAGGWLSLIVFAVVVYGLVVIPLRKARRA